MEKKKITIGQWIYLFIFMLFAIFFMFMSLKALLIFRDTNTFKPDFEFEYWEKWNNPSCKFNNADEKYKEICSFLIKEVLEINSTQSTAGKKNG